MSDTNPEIVTISRQELYEMVWSTPIRKLAAAYGISDVGLAKVCARYNIPRPPAGYWAKKEFGKAPPQIPLPPSDDPDLQTVRIHPGDPKEPGQTRSAPEPDYDPDILETLRRANELPKVSLGDSLRGLHPLVRSTKDALEGTRPDEHHMTHPRWDQQTPTLRVSVSEDSGRRALLFLDAFIKAVERVGGKVEVVPGRWHYQSPETVVSFCGEKVATIRLRERYKQQERKPDPKNRWAWQRYDYLPTGRLVLDAGYCERIYCQDTEKGRRIEDAINNLILRWVGEAGQKRIDRRLAEEARRRHEEEERLQREREAELQRRRQALQERQRAEQARVDGLMAEAEAWQQSRTLRAYIGAVEQLAIQRRGQVDQESEFSQWLFWARQQADGLDPLVPSSPSVLDESI